MAITAALKWHGGKAYLAKRIVELMPPHTHFVEPYFGGGSVLFARDPNGVSEIANDINGRLMNFWRVLQDEDTFARFVRRIEATPFSEAEWREAEGQREDQVEDAIAFFVRCRQSLAGRQDCFASITRNRLRRNMNEQASAWLNCIDGLPAVHTRLKRVVILNRPATAVIRGQDGPNTLHYLDPPYLHRTRTATDVYEHEMTERDHDELLDVLLVAKGKVMLSGYHSDLYGRRLAAWTCHEFRLANNAASGARKRSMIECLWCNF